MPHASWLKNATSIARVKFNEIKFDFLLIVNLQVVFCSGIGFLNESYDHKFPVLGGFDKRLRENVEYLDELKSLAERQGVSERVNFITSCSTAERNVLLSQCLCVLYTPKVR